MLSSIKAIPLQRLSISRLYSRPSVRRVQIKAVINPLTDVIVGVIAVSVIVDVASTFYKHQNKSKKLDLSKDVIDSYDSDEELY